jgi:tellurium resistance protein TerD
MSVSLSKGGNVSLTKEVPGLARIAVALGWEERTTSGAPFDLDASALILNANGKVLGDDYFVFYGNLQSPDSSVQHTGDDLVGSGDDSEIINVNLNALRAEVDRIVFAVSIYDAEDRKQNFGQVANAYIRVLNLATQVEMARYDLVEDASNEIAMVFGELYRNNDEWKFRAVGQGYNTGLRGIALEFGVNIQ